MSELTYRIIDSKEFIGLLHAPYEIRNIHIIDDVLIAQNGFNNLKLSNCKFDGTILIKQTKFNNLEFDNCEFNKDMFFVESFFKTIIRFENCIIRTKIQFSNSSFNLLRVVNCEINEIIFKGVVNTIENEDGELYFESGNFEKIEFNAKEINCALKFESLTVKNINFYTSRINKSISFNNEVNIINLAIESSDFYGRIDFLKCTIEDSIDVKKSGFYEQIMFYKNSHTKYLTFNNVYSKHNINIDYEDNLNSIFYSTPHS